MSKRKPKKPLTCQLCHETKPKTQEYWFLEEIQDRHIEQACKACVESRIKEQEAQIREQVRRGERRAIHAQMITGARETLQGKENSP